MEKNKSLTAVMLIAALVGALIAIYLWYTTITGSEIICSTNCDAVTKGEYGKMLGIPVAAYGFAYYFALIVTLIEVEIVKHKLINRQLFGLIVAGVGYTLYLRYLEFFKIGEVCIWCLGSAAAIIVITIAFILKYKGGFREFLGLENKPMTEEVK